MMFVFSLLQTSGGWYCGESHLGGAVGVSVMQNVLFFHSRTPVLSA